MSKEKSEQLTAWFQQAENEYLKSNIDRAIAFAVTAHTGQVRKGTDIPYIFHVLNVGKILKEDLLETEDVVIAGILHDTLEDTRVTEDDIRKNFGENVLRIVKGNSEPDKSETWEKRKRQAIEKAKIETEDVLLVKLADKLDNIKAIERDFNFIGEKIWERFNAPKNRLKWYYQSLREIFARRILYMEFPGRAVVLRQYEICLEEVFK